VCMCPRRELNPQPIA